MRSKQKALFFLVIVVIIAFTCIYSREIHWRQRITKISYVMGRNAASALNTPIPIDQTWVILLERDQHRRNYITENLFQQQDIPLPHAIFAAVDGKALSSAQIEDFVRQNILTQHAASALKAGEIGCALSHYFLWKKVADDPNINYALILEDDVELHPNFQNDLANASSNLPADFDLAFLYNDDMQSRGAETHSEQVIIPVYPSCSHAYIVSKAGAHKLLNVVCPIDRAIDNAISIHFRFQFGAKAVLKSLFSGLDQMEKKRFLFIYALQPTLIKLRSMPSNIQKKPIALSTEPLKSPIIYTNKVKS